MTEMTMSDYYAREIGPRRVGGRYYCGYWRQEYEVLAIHHGAPVWGWLISVRWDDGRITHHATAWDPRYDSVISQPA